MLLILKEICINKRMTLKNMVAFIILMQILRFKEVLILINNKIMKKDKNIIKIKLNQIILLEIYIKANHKIHRNNT